jgi:hypothetical protein
MIIPSIFHTITCSQKSQVKAFDIKLITARYDFVKALFLAPIRHLIPFVATKNTGVTLVFPCSFIPKIFGSLV